MSRYRLVQTSIACPEQYDVFLGDEQVGYLRLRHGRFRAELDHCGGEQVYFARTQGDGAFAEHERAVHLESACQAIYQARIKREEQS